MILQRQRGDFYPALPTSDKNSVAQGTKAALTCFQRKHFIDCFFPITSFNWFQVHKFSFMQPRLSLWKMYNNDKEVFPSEQKADGIQMMQRHEDSPTSFLNSIKPHKTQKLKHKINQNTELPVPSISSTIWDTKLVSGTAHLWDNLNFFFLIALKTTAE